jgi:hypothetical protein
MSTGPIDFDYPENPTWAVGETPEQELAYAKRWFSDVEAHSDPVNYTSSEARRELDHRLALGRERLRRAQLAVEMAALENAAEGAEGDEAPDDEAPDDEAPDDEAPDDEAPDDEAPDEGED